MSEEIVPTDSVSELVQIVDMFVRPSAGWFVTNFVFSEGDRLVFAGGAGLHTTSSMDIEMVGPAYHGEWRCVEPNPLSRFLSRFQFDGDGYFVRLTAQAWSAPDDAQGDTAPSFGNKCLGSVYISEIGSAVWKKVLLGHIGIGKETGKTEI